MLVALAVVGEDIRPNGFQIYRVADDLESSTFNRMTH